MCHLYPPILYYGKRETGYSLVLHDTSRAFGFHMALLNKMNAVFIIQ